jgi:hypothetical protein
MTLAHEPFGHLTQLYSLFARTREALAEYLHNEELRTDELEFVASHALAHIDMMREALKWSIRAGDAPIAELRYLVRPADVASLEGDPEPVKRTLSRPRIDAVAALQHARLVFGVIPRMPAPAISFPGRKSYADIPIPRGPAELTIRVEEIERALWDTATRRPLDQFDPLSGRRAYSFFDAGTWLAVRHARTFRVGDQEAA